jgi:hypothetical protein
MPENDNSRPLKDDSGRKTTSHIQWPGAYQVVLLSPQTSALITYLLTLNIETTNHFHYSF